MPGRMPSSDSKPDDLSALLRATVAAAAELRAAEDPLEAEVWLSFVLAGFEGPAEEGTDAVTALGQAQVEAAVADGSDEAQALLHCLARMAPPEVAAAASEVLGDGAEDREVPPALAQVGLAEPVQAWEALDVFGAQRLVVLGFAHSGRPAHSVCVVIDHDLGGAGVARTLSLDDEPAEIRAAWLADAEEDDPPPVPTPVATAGARVAAAFTAAEELAGSSEDTVGDEVLDDTTRELLPLLRHRLARLPQAPHPEVPAPSPEEQQAMVARFVGSPQVAALPAEARAAAPAITASLVDLRCAHGDGLPLRWSPELVEVALEWVPDAHPGLDDRLVGRVLDAWLVFAAEVSGLPASVREELRAVAAGEDA